MKWYIGQKVLFCPLNGQPRETVITGLRNAICRCGGVDIECNVATYGSAGRWICPDCNSRGIGVLGKWRHESVFRPLEDNFAEEVLEKALKEGIKLADELPRKV